MSPPHKVQLPGLLHAPAVQLTLAAAFLPRNVGAVNFQHAALMQQLGRLLRGKADLLRFGLLQAKAPFGVQLSLWRHPHDLCRCEQRHPVQPVGLLVVDTVLRQKLTVQRVGKKPHVRHHAHAPILLLTQPEGSPQVLQAQKVHPLILPASGSFQSRQFMLQ